MRTPRDILITALTTEKATSLKDRQNRYAFAVAKDSNKLEIKKAIESVFNVRVLDVTTMRVRGKIKAMGRFRGRRPSWKKAVVKLAEGDSIELFEKV
jgi:large subunit ribosomal protein L23